MTVCFSAGFNCYDRENGTVVACGGPTCLRHQNIQVVRCDGFYLWQLKYISRCVSGYCTTNSSTESSADDEGGSGATL